jgi:integrase
MKDLRSTTQRYRDHVQPYIGAMVATDIKPVHIQDIVDGCLTTKGLSPSTTVKVFSLIRAMLNYADRMDLTPDTFRNPCRKVRLPRYDGSVENPLSAEDFDKFEAFLKAYPNQHTARVVRFAMYTGRRMSEILKLEWPEVNLDTSGMVTFKAENTKSGKRQTVPLNDKALRVLKAAQEDVLPQSNCGYVFLSKHARLFYGSFHRDWQCLRKKARETGVLSRHYRFHDLRHTAASRWVSNGVSIYMVQKLLGHADIKTTMRYAHCDSGSLRDAASML